MTNNTASAPEKVPHGQSKSVNPDHLITILNEAASQLTPERAASALGVLLRDLSKDYPSLEPSAKRWESLEL